MNKKFLLIVTISVALSGASCKKLIEIPENPANQIPVTRVFSDSADILSAVAGVYTSFGVSSSYNTGFASSAITVYTGLTGDELMPGGDIENASPFYENRILPDNYNVASIWLNAYQIIYQINNCLSGIANTTAISPALQQQLIGELKFDRAFLYFNMVNLWGGVPLITSTDYKVNAVIARASEDTLYNFILSDLLDSKQKLKPDYPSDGHIRPNLYAVQALLSKVYLYKKEYQKAVDEAGAVISSGTYALEEDLNNVFLDGSAEAIWQLPCYSTYGGVPETSVLVPYDPSFYEANFILAPALLNAFEAGDRRKSNWINYNTPYDPADTLYYAYKYKNLLSSQTPAEDYMMLRLADVYLIRAEALAQLGDVPDALEDVNLIRHRAGLEPGGFNTQGDAMAAIQHERRTELFCEWGNRWFDLKRTKAIDNVLSIEKTAWKSTASLFPIPVSELQSNPYLTQNPGY